MYDRYVGASLCALLLLAASAVSAQPAALATRGALSLSAVGALRLPALDNDALRARDDARRDDPSDPAPYRFAEGVAVAVTPATHGTWETLADGRRVWRLVVESAGAYSLNFGFNRFRLPEGAALWLYPAEGVPEYRAFTSADNEGHGELWTPIVAGERAVVELDLPAVKAGDEPSFELVLGRVSHAYRPAFLRADEVEAIEARNDGGAGAASGSCNVDVVCPEGDPYRDVIRSVGAYTRGGSDICSGVAVNNTAGDAAPYFLTANHCGNTSGNAPSVVVYWNYENSTCRPPGSPQSGGPGDGQRDEFNSGTIFRGSGSASDWALLEFDDPILPEALVWLAGWDRRDQATPSAVAIHHPQVEEKRISFEYDPTSITDYLENTPDPDATHLRITDWDLGTTEPGSSGSPIFSPAKRVVGQLHGGYASCTSQTSDWYGRVHHSMNTGMAAFLDPLGTGQPFVDGREATSGAFAQMEASPIQLGRGETARITTTLTSLSETTLSDVRFENALPADLDFEGDLVASSGTATVEGNTVEWTVDLPPGASATIAYDVRVSDSAPVGAIVNVATVTHPDLENPLQPSVRLFVIVPPDFTFTNSDDVAIPDDGCPTDETSTIVVPAGFDPVAVEVGVTMTQTYRGDIDLRLESPAGTVVQLLDDTGGSDENLDARFTDSGPPGAFDSGDHDVSAPYYEVEGQPDEPLAALADEDAAGTWTLRTCDDAGADVGTLLQWSLLFYTDGAADELEVTATPQSPPVVIPAEGGPFTFTVTLTNAADQAQTFEAWAEATLPNGTVIGPEGDQLPGPVTVTLGSGGSVTRTLVQQVPGFAPPGEYTYTVYVGDYPGGAVASDGFPVTKQAGALAGGSAPSGTPAEGWAAAYAGTGAPVADGDVWGDGSTGAGPASAALPTAFALLPASPNPSSSSFAVPLALPEAAEVRVEAYDLLGRRVAVLADGAFEAGVHRLVFDGSRLAAGAYVVRATVAPMHGASHVFAQRLTLLR